MGRVWRQFNLGPAVGDTTKVQIDIFTPGKVARWAWLTGGDPATVVAITTEQGAGSAAATVWTGGNVQGLVTTGFPVAQQTTAIIIDNIAGPHSLGLIVEYEFVRGCRVETD